MDASKTASRRLDPILPHCTSSIERHLLFHSITPFLWGPALDMQGSPALGNFYIVTDGGWQVNRLPSSSNAGSKDQKHEEHVYATGVCRISFSVLIHCVRLTAYSHSKLGSWWSWVFVALEQCLLDRCEREC